MPVPGCFDYSGLVIQFHIGIVILLTLFFFLKIAAAIRGHLWFSDIPCSNIFTDMSTRARDVKERINKWDLIKIKSFCTTKENSIKMKRETTMWENIFPMIPQTRVWSLNYIKNSHDSTPERQTTQLTNGQRTWTDMFWSRDIWKDAQHHQPSERWKLKPQWDTTSHQREWSS